ncbi:MAG: hypothetical protein GX357_07305 [Firmicutes bacterium]|nr:hypothetical protein [Bacillota bacterium]
MSKQNIPKEKLNLRRFLPWCILGLACLGGLAVCYFTWLNFFAFFGKYQQTLLLWNL